ncbi:DUF402 domain-containing protein [Niameybacter massiliensis]|uniref:DUF402 domain-containing protein n=1 Tax=Holtiella tumoricola TaxID=3018743 RepID=A0AA42DMV4_9FIRM|nr:MULTISPECIES: DUF402 domain-containing protein [Lachnospirales]MDA3731888.1 DUF402 domain-containing protein [Holtiella tumoricola]
MKRKFLDGRNWTWLEKYTYEIKYIEDLFEGYISFLKIESVKEKLVVDYDDRPNVCLCDDGYKGLIFLPDHEKWCASAVFDREGKFVEIYFDIIKGAGVNEEEIPYFDDLYLDVVMTADTKLRILDEEELEEALEVGDITKEDYDMAYATSKKVIEEIIPNEAFTMDFFRRYLNQFESEK